MRHCFHLSPSAARLGRMFLAAVIGFLASAGGLRAETVDYSTDKVLVETKVDTTPLRGKSVTLAEVFAYVENKTNLKFLYFSERIPVEGRITLEFSGVMPLSELFSTLSSIAKVVFIRNNQTIIVRSPIPNSETTGYISPQ